MMRHVAANALTMLILGLVVIFGIVTWAQSQYYEKGPLAEPLDFAGRARRRAGQRDADKLREPGAISNATVFRIAAPYSEPRGRAEVRRVQHPGRRLDGGDPRSCSTRAATWCGRWSVPEGLTSWQVVQLLNDHEELEGEIAEIPPEGDAWRRRGTTSSAATAGRT